MKKRYLATFVKGPEGQWEISQLRAFRNEVFLRGNLDHQGIKK